MTSGASEDLTPAGLHAVVALASGASHGYAVMRFVDEVSLGSTRLPPGTLYRTMARLVADGLVEEVDERDPRAPHDARRRYYRLTAQGMDVGREQASRLARLVSAAERAGLIVEDAPT